MKFGFCPTEGGRNFDNAVEECQLAEEVGFDSTWVNDHQATEGDNYWPAPLARQAGIATTTDELELVTAVMIVPLYHPVHVAQRAAQLDLMSDGRLTLGVGLGYAPEEFDAFGVPMDERAGRMIESLKFFDEFFRSDGPIDFECPFFEVEDWQPIPETVQEPRPPLWVGGWGDKQLRRSIQFSDAWVPGPVMHNEGVEKRTHKLEDMVEEMDANWDEIPHPLMRDGVIAETHEEAVELGKEYLYQSYLDEYGGSFEHPYISQEDLETFEKLAEDHFLVGTPNEVIEQIEDMKSRFALDHLAVRFHHSGMPSETVRDQLELFGEEVIPAFD